MDTTIIEIIENNTASTNEYINFKNKLFMNQINEFVQEIKNEISNKLQEQK